MKFSSFRNGQRCPYCYGNKKLTYNQVKKYIESHGYKLLSKEYKNANAKLKLQCSNNHIFYIRWGCFQQGSRCPICYHQSTSSQSEREIQQFVRSIYDGKIKPNDRNTIINPNTGYNLELDIYLPEEKKAIEFNGAYWHSLPRAIKYDKIKKQQCEQKKVNLLIIKEEN